MVDVIKKLDAINTTKIAIKNALNEKGANISDKDPFRIYATKIDNLSTDYNANYTYSSNKMCKHFMNYLDEINIDKQFFPYPAYNNSVLLIVGPSSNNTSYFGDKGGAAYYSLKSITTKTCNLKQLIHASEYLFQTNLPTTITDGLLGNLKEINLLEGTNISMNPIIEYAPELTTLNMEGVSGWFTKNYCNIYPDNNGDYILIKNCPKLSSIKFYPDYGSGISENSTVKILVPLTRESALDLFNKLHQFTDGKTRTIKLSAKTFGSLSQDDLNIAKNKGWSVSN